MQFYVTVFSFHLKFLLNDHDFEPKDTNFFVVQKFSVILLCLIFYLMNHDSSLNDDLYEKIVSLKESSTNYVWEFVLFFQDKIYLM